MVHVFHSRPVFGVKEISMSKNLRLLTLAQPIDVLVPDIRGMSVHVLDRTLDAEWLTAWPFTGRAPAAVAIRFLRADGEQHGAPLIVHGALEPVR
jgi:hypothetical protein